MAGIPIFGSFASYPAQAQVGVKSPREDRPMGIKEAKARKDGTKTKSKVEASLTGFVPRWLPYLEKKQAKRCGSVENRQLH